MMVLVLMVLTALVALVDLEAVAVFFVRHSAQYKMQKSQLLVCLFALENEKSRQSVEAVLWFGLSLSFEILLLLEAT